MKNAAGAILKAAEILANDYNFYRLSEYKDLWEILIDELESNNEPAIRLTALKAIACTSHSINRTLIDERLHRRLVVALTDALNGETTSVGRCTAALALSEVLANLQAAIPVSTPIRKHAFISLVHKFSCLFSPDQCESSEKNTEESETTFARESAPLLSAVSRVFSIPEAQEDDFIAYIDVILSKLLDQKSSTVFRSASVENMLRVISVRAIARHIPVTNANRIRVETKFRKVIARNVFVGNAMRIVTSFAENTADFDERSSKESKDPKTGEFMKVLMKKELSAFWSVWYPKISDENLQSLSSKEVATPYLATGFAKKRKSFLDSDGVVKNHFNGQKRASNGGFAVEFFKSQSKKYWNPPLIGKVNSASQSTEAPDKTKEMVTINEAPDFVDCSQLSFNLAPGGIVFNRHPFKKEIFLQNKSTHQNLEFFLQVSPSEYFSATPSFGRIAKGESVSVKVNFALQPCVPRKNSEITGFIQIRSAQGLPFERIGLKGFNTPSLKVFPPSIHFGYCPKEDSRTATVLIQNMLAVECPCILMVSETDPEEEPSFSVPFSFAQPVLLPKEKKAIKVVFKPTAESRFTEKLYIFAMGGDVVSIDLSGYGGPSLKIGDSKIDFGPTDIFYNAASRRLYLENKGDSKLPIRIQCSTDEITSVNCITLQPREAQRVNLGFLSFITGLRHEFLRIHAMNSPNMSVSAVAASGPLVSVPVMEEITFPVTVSQLSSSVHFPIRNIGNTHGHVQLSFPLDSPFSARLIDREHSGLSKTQVEFKRFETSDNIGCTISIPAFTTLVLELVFKSAFVGTFRTTLITSLTKPKKAVVATHYLSAVSINEMFISSKDSSYADIRHFLLKLPTAKPIAVKTPPMKEIADMKASDVFELDPPVQIIFGGSLNTKGRDVWEYVTLTNLSGSSRKYNIAISENFFTNIALEGDLDAFTSIDIPIRFDGKGMAADVFLENEGKALMGQIAVFDDTFGVASSGLHGILRDLVTMEIRKDANTIQFSPVRVMEKSSRKILISNKTPLDLVWEGKVVAGSLKSISDTESPVVEWCPFGLTNSRINLKPFDCATIEVQFQATSTGNYGGRLLHTYTDPVYHIINNEYHRTRSKRDLPSIQFFCEVGTADVEVDQDFVNFGEIENDEISQRALTLGNHHMIDCRISTFIESPFKVDKLYSALQPHTSVMLNATFGTGSPRFYSTFLWIRTDSSTRAIPIFANAGFSKLVTNIVEPLKSLHNDPSLMGPMEEKNLIDFKFVEQNSSKTEIVEFKNVGTFDIIVKNIVVAENGHLIWKFADDIEPSFDFDIEMHSDKYWELKETDWDDIDYKLKELKDSMKVATTVPPEGEATKKQGCFTEMMKIETERSFGEAENYSLWGRGIIQPAFKITTKKVEFGTKAVHSKHMDQICFENTGSCAMAWTLKTKSLSYSPITKCSPRPLPQIKEAITNPVRFYPTSGILKPLDVQIVEVAFCPNLPQYDVTNALSLSVEDFHSQEIIIHGVGASSEIVLSDEKVDFGVLRVDTAKTVRLQMTNQGILPTKYFVECGQSPFVADPEEGILDGNGTVDLCVTFSPRKAGDVNSYLKITLNSEETYLLKPKVIPVVGMASYPDIVVMTKVVDFGVALFGSENSKPIFVENKGCAEAEIVVSCSHPAISLAGSSSGKSIIMPGKSKRDIYLTYIPEKIEILDVKVFLRSSDARGDYFMIQLYGTVGVPKILFSPPSVTKELDFGVCAVHGHQKQYFTMKNDGNINLTVSIKVEVVKVVENGIKRPASSKIPVFTVEYPKSSLPTNEEMEVCVVFTPQKLAFYEYRMIIKYDFRIVSTYLRGKRITVANAGNLGITYHIRPEGAQCDWDHEGKIIETDTEDSNYWINYLNRQGLKVVNPDGFCSAMAKTDIIVEYFPQVETAVNIRFRIYFDQEYEDVDIFASAAVPKLTLMDSNNENLLSSPLTTPQLDLGVHPINSEFISMLKLVNEGSFAVDFLIQPIGIREFDVYPVRGFIGPGNSIALKVFFNPTSEERFQMWLKVLWEGSPLKVLLTGSGGIGKLDIVYLDEKNAVARCLDFNMVPFNANAERRIYLWNIGLVPMEIEAESDSPDFTISTIGEPFPYQKGAPRIVQKKSLCSWNSKFSVGLMPSTAVEIAAKFFSKTSTPVTGRMKLKSDCCEMTVQMRGKGGTFSLSHRGDLSFGDIASNFTYSRRLTIVNSGSIPSNLVFEWLVVGQVGEGASSYVKLAESYSNMDPRSGFSRISYCADNKITDLNYKFNAKDYWKLIARIVRIPQSNDEMGSSSSFIGRNGLQDSVNDFGSTTALGVPAKRGKTKSSSNVGKSGLLGGTAFGTRKPASSYYLTQMKRRQTFFHLISSTQVSSQSTPLVPAFIKVTPGNCLIPGFGEVSVNVEVNLSTEDTVLATLLIKSDINSTSSPYEIALTATPKIVSIFCNDTQKLDFYRQPIGEPETLVRTFTNVGHHDINYKIINANPALTVVPTKGSLKVGQTVTVQFIFKATDESLQTNDVLFVPDCSQHIRLKMSGGGGYAKASLAKYRRFDFGHCMIGKDTVSLLPITNEGNAILHLTRFELNETDTFFKGIDWPTERISLFPGQSYNLSLVFNPHEETPAPGKLTIGSQSELWEIELIGLGREAVLIVSKVSLEFSDCLIGNSYERKLGLKNVGDVNYPVTFNLDRQFPDLAFIPPSLVIDPFSEHFVIVSYTPSAEIKSTVIMTVASPYSTHKIPVSLHSGTAKLEFSTELLDFGMFERVTRPFVKLGIKNVGTVKTSFTVRDSVKPSMFQLSGSKGMLLPGKSAEVTVTHVKHSVCQFNEKLVVRTDLIDSFYYVDVVGQCEESLLKPEEFSLLSLGICPVLDTTTKTLKFKNYGKFPLDFQVKSAYPLKVHPLFGQVLGGDWAELLVSWSPSGGYELRTQLTLVTNIGNYNVIVRGKAAFPELFLKTVYIDFGVCGVGFPYTQQLSMLNKGKVPLHFNIPTMRDPSYSVSQPNGFLDLKQSIDVDIIFKPSAIGRFACSFIVECRGVSYKEVVVVGIGGTVKLDIAPSGIDLGQSPCDLKVYHIITLSNSGDVVQYVDWEAQPDAENSCVLHLPEPVTLIPGRALRCILGATAQTIGPLAATLIIKTKEQKYKVLVSGIGVRIVLTEKSRRILDTEKLPVLGAPGPLGQEIAIKTAEYWFKRKAFRRLQTDLRIVELISECMKNAPLLPANDPAMPEDTRECQEVGSSEVTSPSNTEPIKQSTENNIELPTEETNISTEDGTQGKGVDENLSNIIETPELHPTASETPVDRAGSQVSEEALNEDRNPPTAQSVLRRRTTDSVEDQQRNSVAVPSNSQSRNHSVQRVQSGDFSISIQGDVEEAVSDEVLPETSQQESAISTTSTKFPAVAEELPFGTVGNALEATDEKQATDVTNNSSKEEVPAVNAKELQPDLEEVSAKEKWALSQRDTLDKQKRILEQLAKFQKGSAFAVSGADEISKVSSEFIALKKENFVDDYELSRDAIVKAVVEFGELHIFDIAIEELTDHLEPETELDLSIILARPLPFPPEKETVGKMRSEQGDSSKKYKEFPSIQRAKRNAKTVSFFKTF
ncbi:hypothetical protein HDU82_005341 [Entophlyctis luteolus]|nr:hypothetical protein HDU82_005341 [Entophlyctis luteolus]